MAHPATDICRHMRRARMRAPQASFPELSAMELRTQRYLATANTTDNHDPVPTTPHHKHRCWSARAAVPWPMTQSRTIEPDLCIAMPLNARHVLTLCALELDNRARHRSPVNVGTGQHPRVCTKTGFSRIGKRKSRAHTITTDPRNVLVTPFAAWETYAPEGANCATPTKWLARRWSRRRVCRASWRKWPTVSWQRRDGRRNYRRHGDGDSPMWYPGAAWVYQDFHVFSLHARLPLSW